jgi:hypothetical protein
MIWILDLKNVMFEAKVFNRYDTFDWIVNKNMEDPSMHICIVIF